MANPATKQNVRERLFYYYAKALQMSLFLSTHPAGDVGFSQFMVRIGK